MLENGRRSLILIADNNFQFPIPTQFLAFEVSGLAAAAPIPEPSAWMCLIGGLALLGTRLRASRGLAAA